MAADTADSGAAPGGHAGGVTRRDFLYVATASAGAVGTALAMWPLIDAMNPSADVLALSAVEVDLSAVAEGQSITVMWRKQPVFVRRRTQAEIDAARAADGEEMPDPQPDAARVQKPEWLILVGICTHLGCIPIGMRGDFGGWLCPCHGSHYDTSGRIRKGPAPRNLDVPNYVFLDDTTVRIG